MYTQQYPKVVLPSPPPLLLLGVPFGGYKDSGLGREKSEYALHHYTQVKAVYQPIKDTAAWR